MTTIIDNRKETIEKNFDQLEIGEFYEDCNGNLCLKISHSKCLYHSNGQWDDSEEDLEAEVSPLLATITIERS